MARLTGKVAIVTGSGGVGSGRAIAERFAREGARVIVSDIDEAGGAATIASIRQAGGVAEFVRADMRIADDVRQLIAAAEKSFSRLDILVNGASAPYRPGPSLDAWEETLGVDLLGVINATKHAIEAMRRAGGGAIVNFSSTSAFPHGRPRPGGAIAYDVAKAGVVRLTTMLSGLAASEGIRVNCIAPDWIAVPELQAYFDSLTPEARSANHVPSRLTSLDEIAEAVLRLATDQTLAGRILVWWSDDAPRLIPWADPGYAALL